MPIPGNGSGALPCHLLQVTAPRQGLEWGIPFQTRPFWDPGAPSPQQGPLPSPPQHRVPCRAPAPPAAATCGSPGGGGAGAAPAVPMESRRYGTWPHRSPQSLWKPGPMDTRPYGSPALRNAAPARAARPTAGPHHRAPRGECRGIAALEGSRFPYKPRPLALSLCVTVTRCRCHLPPGVTRCRVSPQPAALHLRLPPLWEDGTARGWGRGAERPLAARAGTATPRSP